MAYASGGAAARRDPTWRSSAGHPVTIFGNWLTTVTHKSTCDVTRFLASAVTWRGMRRSRARM